MARYLFLLPRQMYDEVAIEAPDLSSAREALAEQIDLGTVAPTRTVSAASPYNSVDAETCHAEVWES